MNADTVIAALLRKIAACVFNLCLSARRGGTLCAAASALCLPFAPCSFAADAVHPNSNVLFLAVDDMKDWVNCLGGYAGTVHTPHIDRLAGRGMLFTNAHCPSPKCAPSRAAIMTGLRPSTTGLYDNGHWWLPNLPDVVTLPQHFRNHGYRVVGAGKIFHHTAGNNPPNQWDDFFRLTFRNDPWFRGVRLNYPWSKSGPNPNGFPFSGVQGLGHENDWGSLEIPDEQYDDALSADYAVAFLKNHGDQSDSAPFFLACGLFRPHLPWYVPQKFFDLYPFGEVVLPEVPDDDLEDVPDGGLAFAKVRRSDLQAIRKTNAWKQAVRAYLASISYADQQLGRVLNALDHSPHATNTVIVFWSDHGWHLGEKKHWHKSTLWEEATRVPLIIRSLRYRPGVCDRPVSLLDLYPTLTELCTAGFQPATLDGIRAVANPSRGRTQLDGVSLVPLLQDPKAEWNRPAVIEYKQGNVAVRSERYRYIRYRDGGEELYDHRTDPHEWNNIAAREDLAAIKSELTRWITKQWAEPALTKGAFRFDPDAFTWTHRKTGSTTHGKDE
jgi:choline-sulfatase